MPLLALAVTAAAVTASVVIPKIDRTIDTPADRTRAEPDVEFAVIDDTDPSPMPSPTPTPSATPRLGRSSESAADTAPARRVGARRVSVQSGEIEEASTDQELEEEEEEQRLEEAEERAEAREDRRNRDD